MKLLLNKSIDSFCHCKAKKSIGQKHPRKDGKCTARITQGQSSRQGTSGRWRNQTTEATIGRVQKCLRTESDLILVRLSYSDHHWETHGQKRGLVLQQLVANAIFWHVRKWHFQRSQSSPMSLFSATTFTRLCRARWKARFWFDPELKILRFYSNEDKFAKARACLNCLRCGPCLTFQFQRPSRDSLKHKKQKAKAVLKSLLIRLNWLKISMPLCQDHWNQRSWLEHERKALKFWNCARKWFNPKALVNWLRSTIWRTFLCQLPSKS